MSEDDVEISVTEAGGYRERHCAECNGRLEAHIDYLTDRYRVTLPSRCPTKDACEESMVGSQIVRHRP